MFATIFATNAETWTPVGQVQWTEGALTGQPFTYYSTDYYYNKTWNVSIERSDNRTGVYRLQPYASNPFSNFPYHKSDNVYLYLHTENPQAVYIEYFIYNFFTDNYNNSLFYHVFQRCQENGFDSKYYGSIIDDKTIEFPIGSFAVNKSSNSTKLSAPTSSAKYSTAVHKIVFPEGVLDYTPAEETWVNIGTGHHSDPFFSSASFDNAWGLNVEIEKSVQNPGKYRYVVSKNPITTVVVHAENPEKVYIEPYSLLTTDDILVTITQKCPENGYNNSSNYGTLKNGKITISKSCFVWTVEGSSASASANYDYILTLPDGYDNPIEEENGVFMGIIAFNDQLTRKQISILNESTIDDFTSFVDGLQMGNATLLYYADDQAINSLKAQTYPSNLSNAVLITFTDGLDQGSLAMEPSHRTSRGYADYLAERIASTSIQNCKLEAHAIGLMSSDVVDDELFRYNLSALASSPENVSSVNNIDELQTQLTQLFENLNRKTTKRTVSIIVPMMSHGDKYRFTLDGTADDATKSKIWFEGVFNIDNLSLENIVYNGLSSASGSKITAKQEGVYLQFTLEDCRNTEGDNLSVDKQDIDQWTYIASRKVWQHNVENDKDGKIDIQDIKSSLAVMFALDCSTSLGNLFPLVKSTANSFIMRLAGQNGLGAIDHISSENKQERLDLNDPEIEIYNLQGCRVTNPDTPGIYIARKGNIVQKILVK